MELLLLHVNSGTRGGEMYWEVTVGTGGGLVIGPGGGGCDGKQGPPSPRRPPGHRNWAQDSSSAASPNRFVIRLEKDQAFPVDEICLFF